MEPGWVPRRGRETGPDSSLLTLMEREILSLPSSGLWAAMGPQTETFLVFKNTASSMNNAPFLLQNHKHVIL